MSGFTAANTPGGGYGDDPNPFEVLCLPASDRLLTMRAVRAHKKLVVKHVFERAGCGALTTGFWVPTWQQVNIACDQLAKNFSALRARYANSTQYRWNPYADVGSAAARIPWQWQPREYRLRAVSVSDKPFDNHI